MESSKFLFSARNLHIILSPIYQDWIILREHELENPTSRLYKKLYFRKDAIKAARKKAQVEGVDLLIYNKDGIVEFREYYD